MELASTGPSLAAPRDRRLRASPPRIGLAPARLWPRAAPWVAAATAALVADPPRVDCAGWTRRCSPAPGHGDGGRGRTTTGSGSDGSGSDGCGSGRGGGCWIGEDWDRARRANAGSRGFHDPWIKSGSPCTGGPCRGAAALDRKRECGHDQLFNDYFQPKPLFPPALFRRCFRMSRPLFCRIMDGVKLYDDYFCAKVDAIGKVGLSSYQKCTAAIRMLAYGVAGDFVDEYTRMSESTGLEAMYRFCRAVIGSFGEQYLRQPNAEDIARLLSIKASRGFLGSLAA
ncbi:hypothetical protein QYE76_035160 [Lolium multiflorum]|uniref:Uncharacterized protein n=1 Tax=Lolium multiflorum TaxID=4521 RepID=A0AAD8R0D6_LOLMU|nr:hypothetical protein QYE76_035160 [Lolium multiflorum]